MREMKNRESAGRGQTPLIVRGSLPRVFLSLGIFIEAGLLFCGSYLLADALLQPLNAGTFSVVGGGMFLGLATVLLFYLSWPGKKGSMSRREKRVIRPADVSWPDCGEAAPARRPGHWAEEKKTGLLRPM